MDVKTVKTAAKQPAKVVKLTERYDLSIPANAEGNVREVLQKACDKFDIWPFRVAKGKKGTAVALLRNPNRPAYLYTESLTHFINHLKMEFCVTTIVMRRTPCRVNMAALPPEMHEICEKREVTTNTSEELMLKNLEEDIGQFNSHCIQQLEEADYDTKEVREANLHAIKRQRYAKKCPLTQQETPTYYSNGRQKTMEGQMTFDLEKLMKKSVKKT